MILKKVWILFFVLFKQSNGIMILQSQSPLLNTAFAEIGNSSLEGLDRFTICARFFPYQFQDSFSNRQGIITTDERTVLLGSTTTGKCNFQGCREYFKNLAGDKWKYGRAFSWTLGNNSHSSFDRFMSPLKPQQWYGMCIVIDLTINAYKIHIENETVSYSNHFDKWNFRENITLFNMRVGGDRRPFYGQITDVNVWGNDLTEMEIKNFISCEKPISGDYLAWDIAILKTYGLDMVEKDFNQVCRNEKVSAIAIYPNQVKSQKDNLQFCKKIGSEVATAHNDEELKKLYDIFSKSDITSDVTEFLFFGIIFTVKGWVDINNNSITTNWDNHRNYKSLEGATATCLVSDGSTIYGEICSFTIYPICKETETFTGFQLRGVCLNSGADTQYIFINSTFLLGYLNTEMVFLINETRWIIRNTTSRYVIATLNGTTAFPIGKNKWHFSNGSNCTDGNETFRTLFLHLDVAQPGNFCCDDGTCLDWESAVGNSVPQCEGGEDEDPCPSCGLSFITPGVGTLYDQPNLERIEVDGVLSLVRTKLRANFTVIDVFSISETEGTFEIYFVVQLMWKDVLAKYVSLKDDENMNFFEDHKIIWTPSVGFFHWRPLEAMDYGTKMLIQKNTDIGPTLSAGIDSIEIQEVYFGRDHYLKYVTKQRAKFLCNFDKIRYYPHGHQECSMGFYIKGHANNMTYMVPEHLEAEDNVVIGDYILKAWRYEADTERASGEQRLKVTMILVRKFHGIFMVTYFPSILMNVINQASNLISGDSR